MSRRGKVILIALLLLLVPGYFAWREAARWRQLRAFVQLSDELDADLDAFEAQTRERPPLRVPAEEGSAEEYYFRAVELLGESGDVEAAGPVLPLVAAGTRTVRAGVFYSPRAGPLPKDDHLREVSDLARLLEREAVAALAAGHESLAMDRVEELLRFGIDECTGRLHAASAAPPIEIGLALIRRFAESARLSPDGCERAASALRELHGIAAPPAAAYTFRSLEIQAALRGVLIGSMKYEDLTARDPELWPARSSRLFGLLGDGPDDGDILEAWRDLREDVGSLRAALESGEPGAAKSVRIRMAESVRDDSGSFYARLLSSVVVPGDLAGDHHVGLMRDVEAILLGLAALRYRQREGEWPAAIEEFRPADVPESPRGGEWSLSFDRATGRPAIHLEGGRTWSYDELRPRENSRHRAPGPPLVFQFR